MRLDREDESGLASILSLCGTPMTLICTCCGEQRTVETRCKKRWCPVCARQISAARVGKYAGAVESMQWPLFVTLTVPNVDRLHLDTIRWMRRAYRKLRQRKWWGDAVKGGIASLEITNTGKGWHPHIHSILDCRWLSKTVPPPKPFESRASMRNKFERAAKEVAAEWANALGVPRAVVHVKRAYTDRTQRECPRGSSSIAVEVLKYAVKPDDLIDCAEPIGDLIRLMGAARMVSSFGSCYGRQLDTPETPYAGGMCECGASGAWMPEDIVDRIAGRPRKYA